jgi:mannose-6-phosphate isomerase-like protein (cupin superfamily)
LRTVRIRKLTETHQITAGDGTRLRELLHPDRDYPFSGRYSLAHAIVPVGGKSVPHRLATDEVYYILDGDGVMHIDSESSLVTAGDAIDIPPQTIQWIENTSPGELVFLCIVDPAWRREDEDILG